MGSKSNERCPYKERIHRNAQRRLCEDRDRDWNDAVTSQSTPRIAGSYQELEEASEDS